MATFNSYVSLPEGTIKRTSSRKWQMQYIHKKGGFLKWGPPNHPKLKNFRIESHGDDWESLQETPRLDRILSSTESISCSLQQAWKALRLREAKAGHATACGQIERPVI